MCPGKSQREGGCLGFRITANHHGIKMFTGCGGISSVRMIFLTLLFLPCEFNSNSPSVVEAETFVVFLSICTVHLL